MFIRQQFKIWVVALLFLFSGLLLSQEMAGEKVRGLWIVRDEITSPQKIDQILKDASRWRFTDLFVQVRGRGDAYYQSAIEPRAENLPPGFDPLGYFLQQSQNFNFRVHAWINVFYVWSQNKLPDSDRHTVNRYPEQIASQATSSKPGMAGKNRSLRQRNREGIFVSPLMPEVQKHIIAVVDDILGRYNVDGVHLDYIRFPNRNFDFNPVIRRQFRKRYIIDPLEFKQFPAKFAREYSNTGFEVLLNQWTDFLRSGLSDFVRRLTENIRKKKKNIIISAAVKADLSKARLEYYQEWDKWLREGWLDWALPMNYSPNHSVFKNRLNVYRKFGLNSKSIVGIALYNQSLNSAIAEIKQVQKMPFRGFVLFSYRQLSQLNRVQQKKLGFLIREGVEQ